MVQTTNQLSAAEGMVARIVVILRNWLPSQQHTEPIATRYRFNHVLVVEPAVARSARDGLSVTSQLNFWQWLHVHSLQRVVAHPDKWHPLIQEIAQPMSSQKSRDLRSKRWWLAGAQIVESV